MHTRLSIISPTLVLEVKMRDTSDPVRAADVQLIKMKLLVPGRIFIVHNTGVYFKKVTRSWFISATTLQAPPQVIIC